MQGDLIRRLAAEALGTAFLLATVVGSGIMAERLADGNVALALLGNTIPTGAILVVLILIFGPLSGAHFNPAVTTAFALRREITVPEGVVYVMAQIVGGIAGVWAAHVMFELPVLQASIQARTGPAQWFAEFVATFGLLAAIFGAVRWRPQAVCYSVGLYITAAYWFTASTSFANPAVTIARGLSDTFSGIAPAHVPAFIMAQLAGALGPDRNPAARGPAAARHSGVPCGSGHGPGRHVCRAGRCGLPGPERHTHLDPGRRGRRRALGAVPARGDPGAQAGPGRNRRTRRHGLPRPREPGRVRVRSGRPAHRHGGGGKAGAGPQSALQPLAKPAWREVS